MALRGDLGVRRKKWKDFDAMLDEFFEERRAVKLRNALQTSQNHVVAVGMRGEVRDVALQNREKRVDHAGSGAILRVMPGKVELLGRDSAHSAFRGCSATHRSRTRVLQRATFKKPIQKYDLRATFLAAHLEKHLEDVVAEGILHELAQTALQLLEDLRHRGGARGQQDLLQGAAAVVVLGHFHHVAAQAFELDLLALGVGPRLGFGLGFGLRSGRDGALGLGLGLGLEVVGGLGVLAGSALGLSVAVAVAFSGSEAAARDPLARGARRGLELRGRAGHGRTGRAMPSGSIGVARRIGSIQNTRCGRFVRFGGS